jgi:hypothetical protein
MLYALNPDGSLRWSFDAGAEIESSPTIDDQGLLYIGTFAGDLFALGTRGSDVGTIAVDLPTEVAPGSVHAPHATLHNFRAGAESFPVTCVITKATQMVYADTTWVSALAETTSVTVDFEPWTAGADSCVTYWAAVSSLLADDTNLRNDFASLVVRTSCSTSDVDTEIPGAGDWAADQPASLNLASPSPNPIRSQAVLRYVIPAASGRAAVSLRIYDAGGRLVRTLVEDGRSAGSHELIWDGRDDTGHPVPDGVHFCRLKVADRAITRRLVCVR